MPGPAAVAAAAEPVNAVAAADVADAAAGATEPLDAAVAALKTEAGAADPIGTLADPDNAVGETIEVGPVRRLDATDEGVSGPVGLAVAAIEAAPVGNFEALDEAAIAAAVGDRVTVGSPVLPASFLEGRSAIVGDTPEITLASGGVLALDSLRPRNAPATGVGKGALGVVLFAATEALLAELSGALTIESAFVAALATGLSGFAGKDFDATSLASSAILVSIFSSNWSLISGSLKLTCSSNNFLN